MIGRCRSASAVPRPSTPLTPLRVAERQQPGLRQRVDRDDGRAVALGPLQRRQHPGVVGARVLADDEDQLGGVDVVERHRALADADRPPEGHAARLVAHVRAVREVVGAERPHHQLVDERGLVARAPRRVEHGAVRRRQRGERRADAGDRGVPVDRHVVRRARRTVHRRRQAALLTEPVVGLAGERRDRVLGEERRGDPPVGGLLGDGLGPVLAELDPRRVVRLGPGAARGSRSRRAG